MMLAHRIVSHFSFLEAKTILVQAFTHETHDFSSLCSRLHNFHVVNKFRTNNEKYNAINLIMQQNKMHNAFAKGQELQKNSNGLLRPPDAFFIY